MNSHRILLLIIVCMAVFAPILATHDPYALSGGQLEAPSTLHWLGTDHLGRDVFSRLLIGARRSLGVSALAAAVALAGGIAIGMVTVMTGENLNRSILAIVNALLSIPSLLWSLVVITLLGSGTEAVILAVGSGQIAPVVRVVYARALSVQTEEFVLASRAQGAGGVFILTQHILPNCLPVILGYGAIIYSYSLLNSAALTFLGLAGVPGIADWGVMLNEGRATISQAPWIAISAGAAITLVVLSVNQLAEDLSARNSPSIEEF